MLKHFGDIVSSFGKDGTTTQKKTNRSHFQKDSFDFFQLVKNWSKIIGNQIAKETIPLKLQRGNLTILARHAIYAQQLSFLETQMIDAISKEFKQLKGKIDRVTFQVNGSFFSIKQSSSLLPPEAEPKSTSKFNKYSPEYKEAKRRSDEIFCDINDEQIRDSIKSIFVQMTLENR